MNEIVDQILNKLLVERDRLSKAENALSETKSTLFRIRDYFDAESEESLLNEVARYVNESEEQKIRLNNFESLNIPDVERALARSIGAIGLTTSGNLKVDAENLARFLETARAAPSSIL